MKTKRTHLNMRLTPKSADSLEKLERLYPSLSMTDIINFLINEAAESPPHFTIVIAPAENGHGARARVEQ